MKTRRGFLANIGGIATVPFLGKVIEASQEDVEEYGKSNIYLDKRKIESQYTEMTLKVKVRGKCPFCIQREPIITNLLNNNYYHMYHSRDMGIENGLNKDQMTEQLNREDGNKCILLSPSTIFSP